MLLSPWRLLDILLKPQGEIKNTECLHYRRNKKKISAFIAPVSKRMQSRAHLGAIQADDSVDIACAVIEIGDSDCMLAGGQPVLLGVGINLEDVGPRAVNGLLPKGNEEEVVNLFVP